MFTALFPRIGAAQRPAAYGLRWRWVAGKGVTCPQPLRRTLRACEVAGGPRGAGAVAEGHRASLRGEGDTPDLEMVTVS